MNFIKEAKKMIETIKSFPAIDERDLRKLVAKEVEIIYRQGAIDESKRAIKKLKEIKWP